jgi:exopolysaccharide biosynthesis polyprenyl glycosylphosphotransferase
LKQVFRRNWRTYVILAAIVNDIIVIILSGIFAFIIRSIYPNIPHLSNSVFFNHGLFYGIALIFFALLLGVYRSTLHSDSERQYFLAGKTYIYSILSTLSFLYLIEPEAFPRKYTILFFIIVPILFTISRIILSKLILWMQRFGFGIHNTIIAGYDNGGMAIIKRFKKFPELGYNIKGIITNSTQSQLTPVDIHGTYVNRYSLSEIGNVLSELEIDRAFVPATDIVSNGYADVLEQCRRKNIKLKVLSEEADNLLSYSHIDDIAGITLFSPPRIRIDALKRILKRVFDLIFATCAIILISPILIATSIAILIETGMPIIFKQKRAALKDGKTFYFFKFRSMIKNADEMKESLFDLNESDGALFKIKDDPRMTKVGKFIRRYSIDELPQLINVLKGEMSIIGPRPLPISDLENLNETKEYWESIRDREKMKPGITGLWQISGRSKIGFKEMISLDLYYVENQSLLFDLEIVFATFPVVLFGRGAS